MSDLISAQESVTKIIDTAIRQILSGEQKLTKEYEQSVKDAVNVILDTARREAQDEIVRCKGCKYNSNMCGNYVNCDIIPQMFGRTVDNFCSRAERRTDEQDSE